MTIFLLYLLQFTIWPKTHCRCKNSVGQGQTLQIRHQTTGQEVNRSHWSRRWSWFIWEREKDKWCAFTFKYLSLVLYVLEVLLTVIQIQQRHFLRVLLALFFGLFGRLFWYGHLSEMRKSFALTLIHKINIKIA